MVGYSSACSIEIVDLFCTSTCFKEDCITHPLVSHVLVVNIVTRVVDS